MSVVDKLTSLADSVRKVAWSKQKLSIDKMTSLLQPKPSLLTGTDDFSDTWNNVQWWTKEADWKGLTTYSSIYQWSGINQETAVEKGKTYTFSIFAKAIGNPDKGAQFYLPPGGGSTDIVTPYAQTDIEITTEWARYAITFVANTDGKINARLEPNLKDSKIQVCGLKLEEGDMATPYVNDDGNIVITI